MINKKNLFIFFFIFLIGCGYKPIFSAKDSSMAITNVEFLNDSKFNNLIKNKLSIYKSIENKAKFYDLTIKTNYNKSISLKDEKGDPKMFFIEISIEVAVSENGLVKNRKIFSKSFSYQNKENKFDLSRYEKNIENNLINKITEDIILNTQSL